jgi:catechol 2,3-dioxygenase-like lactoylglutathione lyase family enzyme
MATKRKVTATGGLAFNHAMVYARDVEKALRFYRDLLGLKVVDEFRHHGQLLYVRMKSPRGDGTLALHLPGPGDEIRFGSSVRLYFEVRDLERKCKQLEAAGMKFSQAPKMMPWGWKHAYLDDPDGHEVSLYWAGAKRFRKTKPAG